MDDERRRFLICWLITLIDLALSEDDTGLPDRDLPAGGKFFLSPGSPAP